MTSQRSARALAWIALATLPLAGGARETGWIDLRAAPPVHGDAAAGRARAERCGGCHGANGVAPAALFPNLAGQKIDYLYWRLVEIQREARPESPMTSQIEHLDDASLRDLSAYYASLPPAPPTPAPASPLLARGARLFEDGDRARGTPPCAACHGPGGDGAPVGAARRDRLYPVLRAQHAAYLVRRLEDLASGSHVATSSDFVMTPIAKTLDRGSIEAIAAYLESGDDTARANRGAR